MCATSVTERILGIDPGLRLTGFGVIEKQGQQLRYVASGVIRVPTDRALPERLAAIFAQVNELIVAYGPDQIAIEKVFVNVNPNSTLLLGQARGAALAALAQGGRPIAEYTPMQIKQAVVGHGRASKSQIQAMMVRLLSLSGTPGLDAADALACAICHAHGPEAFAAALRPAGGAQGPAADPLATPVGRRARGLPAGLRLRNGRLVPGR